MADQDYPHLYEEMEDSALRTRAAAIAFEHVLGGPEADMVPVNGYPAQPTIAGRFEDRMDALEAPINSAIEASKRYLGSRATNPLTRADGSPIQIGDEYFNTSATRLMLWSGTIWYAPNVDAAVVEGELVGIRDTVDQREPFYRDTLLNKVNENRNWIYPWGGRGVAVLGDSISHMAFSGDAYRNSWVNTLKRCLNAEYDTSSYGFVSLLDTLGSGSTLSKEVHSVARSGTWAELTLEQCEWSISGFALESSTASSSLKVTVPSFQPFFGVWYHSYEGGGVFEVYVNGVLKLTVDTNGALGSTRTGSSNLGALSVIDGGKGTCEIELRVVSGNVRLIGVTYEDKDAGHQLSNFSQSGRRLRWVSQDVIQRCVRGSTAFILALGYNDNALAEGDSAYLAAVRQRIDWIISEATTYGVKVYVLDFVWTRAQTRALPKELKRCADSIPGACYIRFADYLKVDGGLADTAWLTDSIRLFVDAAHPNVLGHKMIAETVAKSMGLGVCTKKVALSYHDWWRPVVLTGDLKNTFTAPGQLTAYRRQGSQLLFKVYLYNTTVNNGTTPVPPGTHNLLLAADLPVDVYVQSTSLFPLSWSADQNEAVTPYVSAFLEATFARGGFRLLIKTTSKRNIEGSAAVLVYRNANEM